MQAKFDPRHYQLGALSSLLGFGVCILDFEVQPLAALLSVSAALVAQTIGDRSLGRPFDPKSALISALSIALLLRANHPAWIGLASALAVSSKFLLRYRGKQVFNPSLFGIAALLGMTDAVWVSAGQWGSGAIFRLAASCLGLIVITRSKRADITWAFLLAAIALRRARSAWLGDPLEIPLHALSNGSFLIFAIFMISDPKIIPDSRPARVLFAGTVAALSLWL